MIDKLNQLGKVFTLLLRLAAFAMAQQAAAGSVTIGILTDGPTPNFARLQNLFTDEIIDLTEGEFEVQFPLRYRVNGNWSVAKIAQALNQLQHDKEVDFVLALGFVSSLVAARSEELYKPTFAPLVLDSNQVDLPRQGNASGVRNLNYLTQEVRFAEDIKAFREIFDFEHLGLLVDKTIHDSVSELAARGTEWAKELGIRLSYVLNDSENQDLASAIPDDVDAVMVAALPRLDRNARATLIENLKKRRLPSYSLIGTSPVEQGLLAATAPDSDWGRLARRNALNIQSVLLGETAGEQSVSFRNKRQLTINMQTARELDISPRFDVLSGAKLLHEEADQGERVWSLSEVAKQAAKSNLEIRASTVGLKANAENEIQARSVLRPQFNTSLSIVQLSDDNPGVVAGQSAERTASGTAEFSQVIYSESALPQIKIQHYNQASRIAAYESLQLDTVQSATVGFLNILKAKTLINIRRRTLELSRTNLDLANDRVLLGSSNASDIYRWESEVATSRQNVLLAKAQLEQATDALNRLIGRPITERFETMPASLDDSNLLVSRQALVDLIDNQRAFDLMGDLFVTQGIESAPEIKQISAEIAAAERQLASNRRSFWRPEIGLSGQLNHTFDEHQDLMLSNEGDTHWQIGVRLTLPLSQGGERRSQVSQAAHTVNQLKIRRQGAIESIEQLVRANLHAVQASYPAIELTEAAAEAARKNLDLVQDNYNQGTVSIIDFLDARDASLNADQRAADAVYDFLIDLMNLQRSTARFDFFLDQNALDTVAEQIQSLVKSAKVSKDQ